METGYDTLGRPVTAKLTSGTTIYALTQTSYDIKGRPLCTAQRMNPSEYASLPASACDLDTTGAFGPDRIGKTIYDAAGQVTQVKTALGTADEANEVTSTYTSNGQAATVMDAESNKTTYEYDGHDRLSKTRYPDMTKGAGTSSTTDYEQPTYDAGSNVTAFRLRDGNSIGLTVDALGRVTAKDLPGSEPDLTYTYDALSRLTGASQTGNALSFTFDALGRNLTQAGPHGTTTFAYDIAGRRTRTTWADGFYTDHDRLVTGEESAIRENGATSGVGVLATFAYDDLGRRTSLTRGNGTSASYTFDAVSRLASLADNPTGMTHDQTLGFSHNPAGQITQQTRSNDLFAWAGHGSGTTSSTTNGLNQLATHGGASPTHDSKGNMTSDGVKTYGYSSENLLTSATGSVTLAYDPLLRLYQVAGTSTTRFAFDGADMIAEYDGANALQRRFVHGPSTDEPSVWYEGPGTTDRRFLHADERGSIVAVSNSSGTVTNVNTYDEYGKPGSGNVGRFQYTGQKWIAELGLYDYKARMYHPGLPRFTQTDPIGYGGGMNRYVYPTDPVNFTDPTGNKCVAVDVGYGWYSPSGEYLSAAHGKFYVPVCDGESEAGGGRGGRDFGSAFGGGGTQEGGGVTVEPFLKQPCPAAAAAITPSRSTTSRAVNKALGEVEGGRSGPLSRPYSREFAQLDVLPNIHGPGWVQSQSMHAGYAWEAPIPSMPGYVVKVYLNDRDAGGRITATITSSMGLQHVAEAAQNRYFGVVGNAKRAVKYLKGRQCN